MEDRINKNIDLLNEANKQGMLPMLYLSLISSDSLVDEISCDKSIEMLIDFLEALPKTDIEDKNMWVEKFNAGLGIVKRDKKNFK